MPETRLSHRRKASAPPYLREPALRAAASEPDNDAHVNFLASWIADRLGSYENRFAVTLDIVIPDIGNLCDTVTEQALVSLVAAQNGALHHLTGNHFQATWGLSRTRPDDAIRALQTAHEILEQLTSQNGVALLLRANWQKQHAEFSRSKTLDRHPAPARFMHLPLAWPHEPHSIRMIAAFRNLLPPNVLARLNPHPIAELNRTDDVNQSFYITLSAEKARYLKQVDQQIGAPPTILKTLSDFDDLGPLKPLAFAASVFEQGFTLLSLGKLLDMDHRQLAAACNTLAEMEVLDAAPPCSATAEWSWRNPERRALARACIVEPTRSQLAIKAERLTHQQQTSSLAEIRHALIAGPNETQKSIPCNTDALHAIRQNDAVTALRHLESTTSPYTSEHPPNPWLYKLRALQIAMTQGNASSHVYENYREALSWAEKCHRNDAMAHRFNALWGLQSYHLVRGEIRAAATIGDLLSAHIKHAAPNDAQAILAHRMLGLTDLLGGHIDSAQTHYTQVINHYDPARHAPLRFTFASDQGALALAHRTWANTLADNQAAAETDEAQTLEIIQRLEHPHTTVHATGVLALAALLRVDKASARMFAETTSTIARQHDFTYWNAWAEIIAAAAEPENISRNAYRRGLDALSAYCATEAQQLLPAASGFLATIALEQNLAEVALGHIEEGRSFASRNACIWYLPELLRLHAKALHLLGNNADAGCALEEAYASARNSGAALFTHRIIDDAIRLTAGGDQVRWLTRHNESVVRSFVSHAAQT